jgi:RNA polymerase sigma-70 factor (ECF subfamily)
MAPDDAPAQLVGSLFRHESGRLLSSLVRLLGVANLELAEDVVQDTLCRALETWKFGRVPENPSGWLMRVARNRALDVIRRERNVRRFAPEVGRLLDSEWTLAPTVDAILGEGSIPDAELRMMFSCCHPRLRPETQVALILKVLCGFSVGEIARAFLTGEAAIEKRLVRARAAVKSSGALYEVSGEARIRERLGAVHAAVYLLFNEGYHGSHPERAVRQELCNEALRLGALLAAHPATGTPSTFALMALLCMNAARLPARLDDRGSLVLLEAQDRSRWDARLIEEGFAWLDRSAAGDALDPSYHLEAAIAACHAAAPDFASTDWRTIVHFYDLLLAASPSPVVALNRAIALGQAEGPERGLEAIAAIDAAALAGYPFADAAAGDLHRRAGHLAEAEACFRRALAAARNPSESRLLEEKIAACARHDGA